MLRVSRSLESEEVMSERVTKYPRRLIEVDLPIGRISAHARREKAIRQGHLASLHIWWARRPLAACRAVILAALWPDPADPNCPEMFRNEAATRMRVFRDRRGGAPRKWEDPLEVRAALLDFLADFADWDNSNEKDYQETSRELVRVAHESMGGAVGTRPLIIDPFAGGGAIPLEALRVGADAFASDLNPLAALLNKVVLEYIPRYGHRLADEVRKWGEWIKGEAESELAQFYPRDADGSLPITYLWARTIQCEGPGCGAEVPLVRSLWLAKKTNRLIAVQLVPNPRAKRVDFRIVVKLSHGWVDQSAPNTKIAEPTFEGTVKRSSVTCPCCHYTTPVARVREQLRKRKGGADDARLYCVVTLHPEKKGRFYRVPTPADVEATYLAKSELEKRKGRHTGPLSLVPTEPVPKGGSRTGGGSPFTVFIYGMEEWHHLFTSRQLLALTTLVRYVRQAGERIRSMEGKGELADAVVTLLAFALDKQADLANSLCRWEPIAQCPRQLFGRQAIPIVWDFAEGSPLGDSSGAWIVFVDGIVRALETIGSSWAVGSSACADATRHVLPNDAADAAITDPPYYDAVPYADLSDFFYVWLRRAVGEIHPSLFSSDLTPKDAECVVNLAARAVDGKVKDNAFFERTMSEALAEARRVVRPEGVGVVVFAHKSTAGWESLLQAMIDAGWAITASWPLDTENASRLRAQNSAVLASSIHIACRPREYADGSVKADAIGDWRDVQAELPRRIQDWMPRLASEGIVGADAIFACLGPALEIFSRYSRVERADGTRIKLKEYLELVWAAVSHAALSMIFKDADTASLEAEARLTAMWLWTVNASQTPSAQDSNEEDEDASDEDDAPAAKKGKTAGYILEFDAARKIAQGLGIDLEKAQGVVEVKGDTARLLAVAERASVLFMKSQQAAQTPAVRRKAKQLSLIATDETSEEDHGSNRFGDLTSHAVVTTVLDRLHQAMILFAAGRAEAMKRLLVEDGAGSDPRFWKLAQSLSALYPQGSEERRWVEGVMARKKGLGL